MTIEQRRALCGEIVTINGRRAVICGAQLRFAQVHSLDGSGVNAEYAWETTARIVANGGTFRT